jgi:hypothetical protein
MKVLLLTLGAGLLLCIGAIALFILSIRLQIHEMEARVTDQAAYKPASAALARLCESDPAFYAGGEQSMLESAAIPPELRSLGPEWIDISGEGADEIFGGGFHHYGYRLRLDRADSTSSTNTWNLWFYSEDSPDRMLETFSTVESGQFKLGNLIARIEAGYQGRMAQGMNANEVATRVNDLLKIGGVEVARSSIRDFAMRYPQDWLDQMLAYAVDAQWDPAGAGRLNLWLAHYHDFTVYLFTAYADAATNGWDQATWAVNEALSEGIDDPDWAGGRNPQDRGLALCMDLYNSHRYPICLKLCDALLKCGNGDPASSSQLSVLRSDALSAAAGQKPLATQPLSNLSFDPFKGIDVHRLVARN